MSPTPTSTGTTGSSAVSSSRSSLPGIILLVTPFTAEFVNDVSKILCHSFELTNRIYIRNAANIVVSDLNHHYHQKQQTDNHTNDKTQLYVAFEKTDTITYFMMESIHPVLILDSYCSSTATSSSRGIGDSSSLGAAIQIMKFYSLATNTSCDVQQQKQLLQRIQQQRQQEMYVLDTTLRTESPAYVSAISTTYDQNQQITGTKISTKSDSCCVTMTHTGKVRDRYEIVPNDNDNTTDAKNNKIAFVTTDRQSGFDRQLALVPYKGAVLNLCSTFWFEQTKDIIGNHLLSVPHPYVSIVRPCEPFPIEFVVRSYLTGSTSTSIWKNYQEGVRVYCGHTLPDGLTKNQSLDCCGGPLLTPTTKETEHDRPISCLEIIHEKWMNENDLEICSKAALELFKRGQQIALQHGLILVDTKYEFGKCIETNEILLIDEIHTPDSSRYWLANSYEERIGAGDEPLNIDKEFLRLWFSKNCDPYKDITIPDAPRDLVLELSRRYIQLYEMITNKEFDFIDDGCNNEESISKVIIEALQS